MMWRRANTHLDKRIRHMLLYFVEQAIWTMSILNRYRPTGYSQVNQYLTGVYYVPSQHSECRPWYVLDGKLKRLAKAFHELPAIDNFGCVVTASTTASLGIPDDAVDYIFTDPPFGENIYYADLNFLVESWHGVLTNAAPEAIVDRVRKKGLPEYQRLMQRCLEEYRRVLKPGRWITIVFHNSRNAVWTAIQEAMLVAGFVVADVRTLDKQQGSFQQTNSTNAVKQDLLISAYKPNDGLEERFTLIKGTEEGVWDFLRKVTQYPMPRWEGSFYSEFHFQVVRSLAQLWRHGPAPRWLGSAVHRQRLGGPAYSKCPGSGVKKRCPDVKPHFAITSTSRGSEASLWMSGFWL